jgi:hypothetical protein
MQPHGRLLVTELQTVPVERCRDDATATHEPHRASCARPAELHFQLCIYAIEAVNDDELTAAWPAAIHPSGQMEPASVA